MGARVEELGASSIRRLIVCCLVSVFCSLSSVSSYAADVVNTKVVSSIYPSEIRIGEGIEFKVLVEYDNGIDIFYPEESAQLQMFEVLKHKATTRNSGSRSKMEIVYRIAAFEAGEFVVPPILITAKDRFGNERNIRTVDHKVVVKTGIAVGSEIMDIIPPMDVTESRRLLNQALSYLKYILPFLSAIAVIAYLLTRRKPVVVVTTDARAKAIERLRMLSVDDGKTHALYFDIADILRSFLNEHLSMDALKMTSGEVLESLRRDGRVDGLIPFAADLFFDLDLVKFSPFTPSRHDAGEAIERAERLIREAP